MLNVASQLKGMAVLRRDTGDKLGSVVDAVVDPAGGRVLGINVQSAEGEVCVLGTPDFLIGQDAVMVTRAEPVLGGETEGGLESGVSAARGLVGTNVVTDDGRLVGKVSDVYISAERPRLAYRVTGSALERFFGGGFFMGGDVPRAYSPDGARLIVPADTEDRRAARSAAEAIGAAARAIGESPARGR
jgi:uncharacterized protein YrrD